MWPPLAFMCKDADPDAFLVRAADAFELLAGRRAADVACGAGRNSAFLAKQGFHVTAIDRSAAALGLAAGPGVATLELDLEAPGVNLGEGVFDLIVVMRYLHRPLFSALERALRQGGLLVYKTFTTEHLRFGAPPRNPLFLLEPGELLREFAAWRVLRYEEEWRGRGTAALLARKP